MIMVMMIDLCIGALVLGMGFWGFRQGFIVAAGALVGLALGVFIGSKLGPMLFSGHSSKQTLIASLSAATGLGTVLAVLGERVGKWLRVKIDLKEHALSWKKTDAAAGMILRGTLALMLCWLLASVSLYSPVTVGLKERVGSSRIIDSLDTVLPPAGFFLNQLGSLGPLPSLQMPTSDVEDPDASVVADVDIIRAKDSMVRIRGESCGQSVQGSGWVADTRLVVTNAHVVAGAGYLSAQIAGDVAEYPASIRYFDAINDVAVLEVDNLPSTTPILQLGADAGAGQDVAVAGFPSGGAYTLTPGRVSSTRDIYLPDIFRAGSASRSVSGLRADVRPGNSGGPILNRDGQVVSMIFAAGASRAEHSGYAIPASVLRRLMDKHDYGQADTCQREGLTQHG